MKSRGRESNDKVDIASCKEMTACLVLRGVALLSFCILISTYNTSIYLVLFGLTSRLMYCECMCAIYNSYTLNCLQERKFPYLKIYFWL